MRKYWLVFILTIKEYFVYRFNFVIWRLRVFLNFLVTFFLWSSVFEKKVAFGHYDKAQLISYIFFANIISSFVLDTRTVDIASDIINGTIMNYILKPLSFFKYYLTRDLADKLLNLTFVFFEASFLIWFFHPPLTTPSWPNLALCLFFLAAGTLIAFYINLCLSFIGFWSNEVWAPRFLFLTLVFFLSGSYFPLDLLPKPVFSFFILTPFPYLFYLPTQILLGRLALIQPLMFASALFWLIFMSFIAKYLWVKGNKSYNFFGR